VEKQMECRLAGETTRSSRRKPPPSQNPTSPDPGLNPGRHGGKRATNRLSYGAVLGLSLPVNILYWSLTLREEPIYAVSFTL
jgi:hypothetical protein